MFGDGVILRSPRHRQGAKSQVKYQKPSDTWPWREDDSEAIKRQKQAAYAEELKKQIAQKTQSRTQDNPNGNSQAQTQPAKRNFMSSLGTLYGDDSKEIEFKRRQQQEFAESLKRQIEEKRKQKQIELEKENSRQAPPTYESIANQASQMLTKLQNDQTHAKTQPIQQTNQPPQKLKSKKNDLAATAPVQREEPVVIQPYRNTINISTESPFDHSLVETPPLGFSLRRSIPIKPPMAHTFGGFEPTQNTYTNEYNGYNTVKPRNEPLRQSNPGPFKQRLVQPNFRNSYNNDVQPVRLGTNSELIYPDGHISAISSPRY